MEEAQRVLDDANGESYLPAENFSNFALLLAAMYKGQSQSVIQGTFNKLYDLIQGTQEANLFETPDNTPRTLTQAIKEVLNIDYNGQQRSNVLVGDIATSQRGKQGSTRDAAIGERTKDGKRTADSAGGIDGDSRGIRSEQENRGNQGEKTHIPQTEEVIGRSLSAGEAENFIADMEENADTAPDIELTIENWDALFGEEGIVATPIGDVKMGENQFAKLMRQGREGKLGMIKPTLENPHAIVEDTSEAKGDNVTKRASAYVFIRSFKKSDGSRYYYFTSVTVSVDGKEVVISNQEKSKNRISNLLQKGVISWINKNVQSASEAQSEESVLLDDSQAVTQADNNTVSLGINSSELSDSKDTTISPTTNELGEKSAAPSVQEQIQVAEAEVNTNPTEAQKEAGREPQRRQEGAVTDAEIEALNAEISENYRTNSELDKDNERFNNELQQQIDGTLPKGHIYKMGMPGKILLSAGVPNMPIEMSSTRLEEKSKQDNHPFEISELKNLVKELQSPIAVFKYGNNAKNVIISIDYQGKQFLVSE
ncbi:MAG: PBECR2 nuclease fold domain-containing protein [Bacteroidales bacterium]|nr:PBECR2 nuclease fold domain-containing protein [Bacteroidales bacterium]